MCSTVQRIIVAPIRVASMFDGDQDPLIFRMMKIRILFLLSEFVLYAIAKYYYFSMHSHFDPDPNKVVKIRSDLDPHTPHVVYTVHREITLIL